MSEPVVITGLGLVACAGRNLAEARGKFLAGAGCLSPIADPLTVHLRARFAGQVTGVAPTAADSPLWDRHILLARPAAQEALAAAGLQPLDWGRRIGLVFSTCSGPMLRIEEHYERVIAGDARLTEAELFAKRYQVGARVLAHLLGIAGFNTTIVTACSASTAAIAVAGDLIRGGLLDVALAGGADAFSTSTLAGFDGLKATAEGRCAPFSKPFGLNLGEAGGFVVVESARFARRRGARVLAEILGSGMSNDAYHCSAPEPSGRGLASAMNRALRAAGLAPDQIGYVNAHGTGTEANDKAECRALHKIFGARTPAVPVSSTKSMVGHCLGAAGAVELIASIACAEAGVLPSTANFAGAREGCAVDCVPEAGRPWPAPRVFLSNNSAFGGHNASLVVAVPAGAPATAAFPPPAEPPAAPAPEPIYLTACGAVCSLGVSRAELAEGLRQGRTGLAPVTLAGLPDLLAGRVDEAAVARFDRRLDLRGMDRSSRFATVATRLALREAGWPEKPGPLAEVGFYLNLAAGPSWAESEFLTSFLQSDRQVRQLAAFPYIVPSSVTGNVCRALRLSGHNLTLNGGPGAGLLGLGPALAALRSGHAGALLCGAVDEVSDRILADSLQAGEATDPEQWPRGEGAVVMLLERAGHARERGARPVAEILGLAFGTETGHWHEAGPTAAGLVAVVQAALQEAKVDAGRVARCGYEGPRGRWDQLLTALGVDWRARRVGTAGQTGCLEATQPLLDLATALAGSAEGDVVLAVVSSRQGVNGAVVVRRLAGAWA